MAAVTRALTGLLIVAMATAGFMIPRKHVPISLYPPTMGLSLEPASPKHSGVANAKPHAEARDCKVYYYRQRTDHFNFAAPRGAPHFEQRYFYCPGQWRRRNNGMAGPIFFYPGNEGDVHVYVNNTGLMWENAKEYGALLVFAEHRYYGESVPDADMSYLTVEQAMADYVALVAHIKQHQNALDAPVILFGGSYGGLLAAWLRLKYPATFHGAVAASAPIRNYLDGHFPVTFWQMVTRGATAEAGAAEMCVANVRATWAAMWKLADTEDGRKKIQEALRVCQPLDSPAVVTDLAGQLADAWGNMAMGSYPYPSSYLTAALSDNSAVLPAWPVRVACSHLADKTLKSDPMRLMAAMQKAVGVYLNATKDRPCLTLNSTFGGERSWVYQTCTELLSHGGFQASDGVSDMFFPKPHSMSEQVETCRAEYDLQPMVDWHVLTFGTLNDIARYGSNIVFSNGNLDPWYGAGVLHSLNPTLAAVIIDGGGHHVDLMFSNKKDTEPIKEARTVELQHVANWIAEAYEWYSVPDWQD